MREQLFSICYINSWSLRSFWLWRVVVAAAFIASLQAAAAGNSPPAMTIPGQFGVSATGGASYSMPIAVPPGTAGMVPALSLEYSSQSGSGVVGLGWNLAGLPSIVRCPRTLAQDGVHGSVNYDSNDRFCMEGQRLVVVSGTYGASGTEYHTEIDAFYKIISYGTAGNGPSYFKVWTKSGQIMEFGNTTDSRILAVGKTTARAWVVSKISDAKGNYLTVTYTNDATNGQAHPSRIDYTGNAGANVSPYNSVQFSYVSRSDITPTYQAGSLQQTTVLLSHIKTYQGSNLVYDYQLAYRLGSTTTRSRLTSVTLCDSNGSCLVPTTFDWQGGGSPSFSAFTTPITVSSSGASQLGFPADVNGDGLADLLPGNSCGSVYLGQSSGSISSTATSMTYSGGICVRNLTASDFNGDGITDILGAEYTLLCAGCGITVFPNLFINNAAFAATFAHSLTYYKYTLGDFNGDGTTDVYLANNTMRLYDLSGQYATQAINLPTANVLRYVGDFNGDGCSDILPMDYATASTNISYFCPSTSSGSAVTNWAASGYSVVVGDFNGDGKSDLLTYKNSGSGSEMLSTGAGFVATGFSVPSASQVVAGDWNADGKTDIAITPASSSTTQIYLSTGSSFALVGTVPISAAISVSDLNSDSAADISISGANYVASYTPELLVAVHNGIGATTSISYDRLNKNGTFYTKCPSSPTSYACGDSYPTQAMDGPMYAVARVDNSNGIGGTYSFGYSYAGAKSDLRGRGFLGFSSMTVTDPQTGVVQKTNYRTDFPYVGLISSQTKARSGVTLSSVTNTYADTNLGTSVEGVSRHFVSLTQSVSSGHDLDGTALPSTTTSYTYDSYGNALTVNTSVSDGSSKNTTNTYSNDTTNWFLGRLTYTSVASTVGSSSITRTSCFQYDAYGLLTREVIEPVSSSNCTYSSTGVQTDYTYDSFGHRITSTVSGSGIATRSSSAGYDALGQFQTSATNALSQSETWVYDARFGLPTSHTGPNGLTTSWTYDSFGRTTLETRPDGNRTKWSYGYCNGTCWPTLFSYVVQTPTASDGVSKNGPATTQFYDSLSRLIVVDTESFDSGQISRMVKEYDANGREARMSRPYFTSVPISAARWTTNTYDALGRVTRTDFPNGGYGTYGYHGLTASSTNDHNQTTTTVRNAQGLVASVTDALNHTTTYTYDAAGNLKTVTDPSGNVITNTYNTRGFKTASSDPDMGSWSYAYDVLGQLTSQTDAKSQTTTLGYDVLGRATSRSESGLYSTWTYGTSSSSHNVGKLVEAKACTSSGCSTVVANRTFTYDGLGRPSTMALAAGGSTHTYTDTYDSNGRLNTVAYPSGFTAQYAYTALGYLSQIKDNSTGSAYWTANARDAEMHLLSQTFGNGVTQTNTFDANTGFLTNVRAGTNNMVANSDYTYDTLGNLTYRADGYAGTFEYACYDSLNRLTQYAAGNGVTACTSSQNAKTVGYDALGNITSKTGVGTYSYPAAGGARPHAVASISGTVNGAVNPSYTYDANGNMTSGAGRTVTYTSFNMAASIVQGSTTIILAYDSEHTRVQMTGPSGTTTYFNDPASGAMSEKLVSGSTTTWHDYLMADGKIVAEKFSGGSTAMRYFVSDHLGSVAVVMNEAGAVVERNAYDAWGKRRNIDGSDDTTCSLTSQTTRGYTGHEQIDAQCLINANARIYDPAIGKFMSADSIVPEPLDLQSYNRYAYVNNRPLSATDPTGHDDSPPIPDGQDPRSPVGVPWSGWDVYANPGSISSYFSGFYGFPNLNTSNTSTFSRSTTTSSTPSGLAPAANAKSTTSVNLDYLADGSVTNNNADAGTSDAIQYADGAPVFDALTGTYRNSDGSQYTERSVANLADRSLSIARDIGWALLPGSDLIDCARHMCSFGGWAVATVMLVPAAKVVKGGKLAYTLTKEARLLGKEGEAAVRAAYDIGEKKLIKINDRGRIPDGLSVDAISEVKNVKRLNFTSQLRDYADYARDNKIRFDLYVRQGSQLSKPLEDARAAGLVNILDIP